MEHFNFFGGAIFNDFQNSILIPPTLQFEFLNHICGQLFLIVISLIICCFSHILKSVEPYGERKKKLKINRSVKKITFREKKKKKNDQLFCVALLIGVRLAANRILKFMIVFELWHFFDFLRTFSEISHKYLFHI